MGYNRNQDNEGDVHIFQIISEWVSEVEAEVIEEDAEEDGA